MGHMPLWHAICLGQRSAAALLRSRGAQVQADIAVDICKAAAKNDAKLFELLLVHNIDMLARVWTLSMRCGCTVFAGPAATTHVNACELCGSPGLTPPTQAPEPCPPLDTRDKCS